VFSELPVKETMGGKGQNFDLYSEGEFFENRIFLKGTIRKFLKLVAVHIEG
jgi:hypothetical protein